MSRIIGCKNLHIAPLTTDNAGSAPVFGTPVAVPSLISLSIADSVSTNNFYSDDRVEQSFSKVASKEITIELGHLSTELEATLTGKSYDVATGALVQTAEDINPEVAILFEAPKSKGGARYVCLYRGILSRNDSEYATQEDTIESSNITLSGTFVALESNGKLSAVVDSDDENADEAVISAWYTNVPFTGAIA